MTFNFSIRTALKESWAIFRAHPWYFVVLSAVMVLLNIVGNSKDNRPAVLVLMALSVIASIIWSYVWLSVSLAAADAKHELLTFKTLRHHLPSVRNFFMILGVGIMTGIFVLLGLIALIIPGIYIMVRLMFANLAYVDRKGRVMQSLRYSWHLVKGEVFWTVLLTMFISFGIMILGIVLLGVGMLIAYPVAMLLIAKLYRALTFNHEEQAVIVQPEELEAPEEQTEPVVA
ncbi:MAG TPA: hypothetical protein VGE18_01160 [Candidatus Paceibacterota bacterium]